MKVFLFLIFILTEFGLDELPTCIEIRSICSKRVLYNVSQNYNSFYYDSGSYNYRIDKFSNDKDIVFFYKKIITCINDNNKIKNLNHVDLRKVILFKYKSTIDTFGYNPYFKYIHYKKNYYNAKSLFKSFKKLEPKK